MKKILALMLVLTMVFAFSACKKDSDPTLEPEYANGEGTTKSTGVDLSAFDGKKLQPYLQMIVDKNFYAQMQQTKSDGTEVTMTFTRQGDNEKISLDGEYSFAKYEGKYYYITQTGYFEVTNEFLTKYPEYATQVTNSKDILASWEAITLGMLSLYPTDGVQNVTLQNVAFHEEYIDVESQLVFSYFFDTNGTLLGYSKINSKDKTQVTSDFVMGTPQEGAISNIFQTHSNLNDNMNNADATGTGTVTTAASTTVTAAAPVNTTTAAPTTVVVQ